jgi:hypothetical protein
MESVPDAECNPKLVVIHTADWHLGQSFLGFNRDVEHSDFLEWLVREIKGSIRHYRGSRSSPPQ